MNRQNLGSSIRLRLKSFAENSITMARLKNGFQNMILFRNAATKSFIVTTALLPEVAFSGLPMCEFPRNKYTHLRNQIEANLMNLKREKTITQNFCKT